VIVAKTGPRQKHPAIPKNEFGVVLIPGTKFSGAVYVWLPERKNNFVALGFNKDGTKVSDSMDVNYRFTKNGAADGLKLSAEKLKNGNYLVTAIAVDKNNLRCLDYEERVYFQCLSGGVTLKNQGTPTGSESIKMSNGKAAIEVIPNTIGDSIEMNILNQNFKGEYLKFKK
jgi:beta-galactosidase